MLLRERVAKLSGAAGLSRLDAALLAARQADPDEPSASEFSAASDSDATASPAVPPHARGGGAIVAPAGHAAASSTHPARPRGGIARGFFNSAAAVRRAPQDALGPAAPAPPLPLPPGLSAEAASNLAMVHDLLHDPSKQLSSGDLDAAFEALWDDEPPSRTLPSQAGGGLLAGSGAGRPLVDPAELEGLSPDQAVALIKARAKAIAEGAFWATVESGIRSGLEVSRYFGICRFSREGGSLCFSLCYSPCFSL